MAFIYFFFVQVPIFLIFLLVVSMNINMVKTVSDHILLSAFRKELVFKIFVGNIVMPIVCLLGMDAVAFFVVSAFFFVSLKMCEMVCGKRLK